MATSCMRTSLSVKPFRSLVVNSRSAPQAPKRFARSLYSGYSRSFSHCSRRNVQWGPKTEQPSVKEKLPDASRTKYRFREFELANRVYVVTGGGQGLGLELAEALIEAGGKVYCLDRKEKPDDEFLDVQERLAPSFGGAIFYDQIDVRNPENVETVIARIASEHGRLDGLIAAAGIQNVKPALDFTPAEINDMLEVNFHGVYTAAVASARQMIKYECVGSIMLVASMSGLIANRGFPTSVYNSSKAAVMQLARSLAMEWGKVINGQPIRVNSLCPGNIITPMVEKNFQDDPSLREKWENANMMGRLSEPREYRGAALFALSDASSFMTGNALVIDGGYTSW